MDFSTRFPAPGEYIYVHVDRLDSLAKPFPENSVPRMGSSVTAYLDRFEGRQWKGCGIDWYEERAEKFARRAPEDGERVGSLGISATSVRSGLERYLRVDRVKPQSPAAEAGIEPGDLIVKANNERVTTSKQLAQ